MSVDKPLPANVDAERFLLGSIMLDPAIFESVSILTPDDFSTESHRKIFRCMGEVHQRNEQIDPIAVHTELDKLGETQACGGLSYLTGLDEGIPQVPNVECYIRIVQEKALLRRGIYAAQYFMNRCL